MDIQWYCNLLILYKEIGYSFCDIYATGIKPYYFNLLFFITANGIYPYRQTIHWHNNKVHNLFV